MKVLKTVPVVMLILFFFIAAVYWFNLDTKLVKAMEKPMMRHYDNIQRDHRL